MSTSSEVILPRLDALYRVDEDVAGLRFLSWEPGRVYNLPAPAKAVQGLAGLEAGERLALFQGDGLTHILEATGHPITFQADPGAPQVVRVRCRWVCGGEPPQWAALFPGSKRLARERVTPLERSTPYKDRWRDEGGAAAMIAHVGAFLA